MEILLPLPINELGIPSMSGQTAVIRVTDKDINKSHPYGLQSIDKIFVNSRITNAFIRQYSAIEKPIPVKLGQVKYIHTTHLFRNKDLNNFQLRSVVKGPASHKSELSLKGLPFNQNHEKESNRIWSYASTSSTVSNNIEDEQWIDPFDASYRQGSVSKYPEWSRLHDTETRSKGLTWELVKEKDILTTSVSIKQAPRIVPVIESVNRSVAFNTGNVGPDIGFLVPPGFRWSPDFTFDSSVRGWSRRRRGQNFLAWNGGDAVGQFHLQQFHAKKWSFGGNIGIRSVTNDPNSTSSAIGEGVSAGFRFDYALSDTAGIAFGAEQLIHFDDKTDTGRDIYLVASKAWWLGGKKGLFPLATATAGVGTGYLGRNPYLQFGCSNFVDAGIAQVDNPAFFPLCWGPIAAGALVINHKISIFSEFNNFAFVAGTSIAPFENLPLRGTFGVTLAQDFGGGEEYVFEADKTRWFFRVSLAL